jgi:hypothetical protein
MNSQVYNAALEGKEEEVKLLVKSGADINMAIMGAADGKQKQLQQWAFENGACILFSFQTSIPGSIVTHKYGKNLSMIKGPGEIAKGTFLKS